MDDASARQRVVPVLEQIRNLNRGDGARAHGGGGERAWGMGGEER